MELKVGLKVEAKYSDGNFYPGVITKVTSSYTIVAWDDGDTPSKIANENHIRARKVAAKGKYPTFDHSTTRMLRKELQEVVSKYAAENGLEISVGSISFRPTACNIKLEAKLQGGLSMREGRDAAGLAFIKMFSPEIDFGPVNGFQIVGYNERQLRKYPYTYVDLHTGKRYKCTVEAALVRFAKRQAA